MQVCVQGLSEMALLGKIITGAHGRQIEREEAQPAAISGAVLTAAGPTGQLQDASSVSAQLLKPVSCTVTPHTLHPLANGSSGEVSFPAL